MGRLILEERDIDILWFSHLYVSEQFRKTLMGLTLTLKTQNMFSVVSVCGAGHKALPIFQKLGWLDLCMPRMMLIRRSKPIVQRFLGTGAIGKIGSVGADMGLAALRGLSQVPRLLTVRKLDCRHMDKFPPANDHLFPRHKGRICFHRSANWVNWLLQNNFTTDPRNRQDLFGLFTTNDNMVGYFLTKVRFHQTATEREFKNILLGSLSDWAIFDTDALRFPQIALLATRELLKMKIDAVEVCLPDATHISTLKRMGFANVGQMHVNLHADKTSPLSISVNQDPQKWVVRPAEGDYFFF